VALRFRKNPVVDCRKRVLSTGLQYGLIRFEDLEAAGRLWTAVTVERCKPTRATYWALYGGQRNMGITKKSRSRLCECLITNQGILATTGPLDHKCPSQDLVSLISTYETHS
jgi:hypothetical protein